MVSPSQQVVGTSDSPVPSFAVDEMGDKVGRVYVDSQDLSGLQARKFKGLKRAPNPTEPSGGEGTEFNEVVAKVSSGGGGEGRKRPKISAE